MIICLVSFVIKWTIVSKKYEEISCKMIIFIKMLNRRKWCLTCRQIHLSHNHVHHNLQSMYLISWWYIRGGIPSVNWSGIITRGLITWVRSATLVNVLKCSCMIIIFEGIIPLNSVHPFASSFYNLYYSSPESVAAVGIAINAISNFQMLAHVIAELGN